MKIIILVIVFSISCTINTVKCESQLKYWEPVEDYEARREHRQQSNYRNRLNNNYVHDRNRDVEFRYTRNFDKRDSKRIRGMERDRGQLRAGDRGLHRTEDRGRLRVRADDRDRHHIRERSQGSKLQQHQFKQKGRTNLVKSTRITPMYLMQQPEDTQGTTMSSNLNEMTETLNPYAIRRQMEMLASKFPDVNITVEVIGRTAEYNDIVLLKISEQKSERTFFRAEESKYMDEVPEKKIIFIVHGLIVMGFSQIPCLSIQKHFEELLSYYFEHLDKFDIFLIPLANPDGVARRLVHWNKNMSPQNACPGVALDRNFDVAWNGSRIMSSCSHFYPGSTPFSEPETQAIRDVFHHYSHKIIAYLNVHGGVYTSRIFKGDAVLYPKGYTDKSTDDDKYIDMKGEIDEAMKNASFHVLSVTVDTLYNWYGIVSGTSVDYASTIYGIPYALELVLQVYHDDSNAEDTEETVTHGVLTELWRRVIDVIFENIWKNSRVNEVK